MVYIWESVHYVFKEVPAYGVGVGNVQHGRDFMIQVPMIPLVIKICMLPLMVTKGKSMFNYTKDHNTY